MVVTHSEKTAYERNEPNKDIAIVGRVGYTVVEANKGLSRLVDDRRQDIYTYLDRVDKLSHYQLGI